jgi:phosphoglycolate phosphatase-like HAD superfamily hydrolase
VRSRRLRTHSGGETIRQLHGELDERGIRLVIAEPIRSVRDVLDRYGLTDLLGADAIYDTVDEAVTAFRQLPSANAGDQHTD